MRKIVSLLTFLLLFTIMAWSQGKISGTVRDQNGDIIPFATVNVKGSRVSVAADANAAFSIPAKTGDVLTVTAVGAQSTNVTVAGSTVAVVMTRSAGNITDVVVTTALGIQRQAKELGYATTKITNKDLTQAKVTNIATGLEGKVSGLQINLADNGVDPQTRIVLRGNRSLTGNNEALLVVDGVQIDDPTYINKINPEDIDNVTVLKGAVAASLYGSKASNGVLVLTTKHGSKTKPTITVGNTTNLEQISYLPNLQNSFGGYGGESAGQGFVNPDGTVNPVPYENESYGPAYDGRTLPLAIYPIFAPDGTTVDHFDTVYTKYSSLNKEKRKFFNTGITNQFNASYSSGDQNGTFYVGVQDVNVQGVVPGDKSRRDNVRVAGSHDNGKFHADYSVSYNQQNTNTAGNGYNQGTGGVFNGHNVYFDVINVPSYIPITSFKDWQNNPIATPDGYFSAYSGNPYWTIDNSRNNVTNYDLLGNVNLALNITSWLTIADRVGVTQTTSEQKITKAGITFQPWSIADPWQAGNVPSSLSGYLAPSSYDQSFLEQRINNDLIGTFNKNFGDFSLKGLVGYNTEQRYQRFLSLEGDNLQFPNDYNISSVLGVPGYTENSYKQREYAIYEDATLGYKDYLYLHATNRDEWNSVLGPGHQHFEYPGVDLSFIFTQAINSLKGNSILSYGKIRGGYTQVSNINLGGNPYGAYELVNPFVPPAGFPFGSIGGYSQSTTYLNPDIQPEKTKEYEAGLELGFYNNRIYFTGDYFNSKTSNQSLTAVISAATGFTNKNVNAGLVTNQGVELDLTLVPIKSRNVTWTIGANYAHYKNVVNDILPGVNQLELSAFNDGVGGGVYAVKGSAYPVIETTDWYRDSATGKVIVDPKTGSPSVDPTLKVYGHTNPTDILGLTTNLTYKGFTLGIVAEYRGGNQIMNSIGAPLDFAGISAHSAENGRQRFIFPNSVVSEGGKYVNNTTVTVDNGSNTSNFGFWPTIYTSNIGSVYVTSAAFWKLREASITYEIPQKLITRTKVVKRATIGVVGRNLFMIRPKSNIWTDPEFSDTVGNGIGGTSIAQTPPTRIFGANLTLTF